MGQNIISPGTALQPPGQIFSSFLPTSPNLLCPFEQLIGQATAAANNIAQGVIGFLTAAIRSMPMAT